MRYYVYSEDFASCLVGPFKNKEEADEYLDEVYEIVHAAARHPNGTYFEVISEIVANHLTPNMKHTPEVDLAMWKKHFPRQVHDDSSAADARYHEAKENGEV